MAEASPGNWTHNLWMMEEYVYIAQIGSLNFLINVYLPLQFEQFTNMVLHLHIHMKTLAWQSGKIHHVLLGIKFGKHRKNVLFKIVFLPKEHLVRFWFYFFFLLCLLLHFFFCKNCIRLSNLFYKGGNKKYSLLKAHEHLPATWDFLTRWMFGFNLVVG